MSSSINLPYIFTQSQNMLPFCQLQKIMSGPQKEWKESPFLSEITSECQIIATYVNFDIYKIG